MYRDLDTALAAAQDEETKSKKKNDDGKLPYVPELPSGDSLKHPRQLWVCGSDTDNDRYSNCYNVQQIDRCVRIRGLAGLQGTCRLMLSSVFRVRVGW
jgi:hypothetical protein